MPYSSWFQCINAQCSERMELTEVVYTCERCGGLLMVAHDMDALKNRSGAAWMKLFDDRYMTTQFPYGSGVWGKKEWIYPQIDDASIVSTYEGGSNLFRALRFGQLIGVEDLWIKQSGNSHTGSFKDLGMTVLVSAVKRMIHQGADVQAVMCASTGDTSAAVAAYCAAADIPSVVLLPKDKVTTSQLVQPLANNALTLALDTDFDGCMSIVRRLSEDKRFYLANSINPLRIEGQKTISVEIVQQDDWQVPDWVIVPSGNLGNITAIGIGFQMMEELGLINKRPRLVAAQAAAAAPLYNSYKNGFKSFEPIHAESTQATAIQIGNPVSAPRAIPILEAFDGIVEQATEDELADAAAMADRTGLFACPQTGVALAALIKLAKRKVVSPDDRVVVISTANGLKFLEFKVGYHRASLPEIASARANKPVEVPGDYQSVVKAITRSIS